MLQKTTTAVTICHYIYTNLLILLYRKERYANVLRYNLHLSILYIFTYVSEIQFEI